MSSPSAKATSPALPVYQPAETAAFHQKREAARLILERLSPPSDKKYTSWERYGLLEKLASLEIGGADPTFHIDQPDFDTGLKTIAIPLAKAIADWPDKVAPLLQEVLPPRDHYFSALSAAYYRTGAVVVVPPNVRAEITTKFSAESGKLNAYRTIVLVSEGADVTYAEELSGAVSADTAVAHGVEVYVHPNAQLNFYSLQDWPDMVRNFSGYRARVLRDARLDWLHGLFGSAFTQMHVESQLSEPGAESNVHSTFFGDGSQHLDQTLLAAHLHGQTVSDTYTRGVLTDQARAVYRGMIAIHRGAHGSAADQNGHAMLLTDTAHADMIPGLEIDADDVTAGHGATVGQVDADQLFYLQSRGLSADDARQLIIRGFFEDLLKEIRSDPVRERFWNAIDSKG